MEPAELEFLAENENISIIPKFNLNKTIHLISGEIGPFRSGIPAKVPIWLALNLKQRQKCNIVIPEWMNLENLEERKENEKQSEFFTKMPNEHYMEVSRMLFEVADDEFQNVDEIRTVIKDLWDLRVSKLRSSIDKFIKSGSVIAQLDYLTQFEISTMRPLLPDSLNIIKNLQNDSDSDEEAGSQNTSNRASASFSHS